MSGNKVQTQNLPDIPSPQDIVDSSGKKVSQAWREWFYVLRLKVNSITGNIINLLGLTGTGILVQTGTSTYANRKLIQGTNITITNPDGVAGNITISSASASPLTTKGDLYTYTTIDARLPVGTDTYVLTASSVASTGLAWAPAGTPSLPVTTKGDLLGFSTVAARIPVGTDGQTLVADSTQVLGVKWGGGSSSLVGSALISGAAATSMTVSGLSLSSVVAYEIVFALQTAVSSADLLVSLYYNGDTTESHYRYQYLYANLSTAAASSSANAYILDTTLNFGTITGSVILMSTLKNYKHAMVIAVAESASGSLTDLRGTHQWANTANVTSITLSANSANGLAIGSYMKVYIKN